MKSFGINIEDGSTPLPQFVVDSNDRFMELYDWQTRALNFFNERKKVLYEVTTGAGKTFCAIQIMKYLMKEKPNLYTLIIVPKNVILERTWFKELYDNGFNITKVGVFYGLAKEYNQITITNMQNLHRIELSLFDLCIFDEIHNYGTPRLMEYVKHNFKYKIGLTATVERMDDKHYDIIEEFDYNVFKYSPKQALKEGILNPFNFINVGVEMDEETERTYLELTQEINLILQMGGSYSKIMRTNSPHKYKMLSKMNERKQLVNNYPRKFDIIKKICKKHRDDKILVFNQFNEQTNKCYWYLLDVGIKARVVHSGIKHDKREQALTDFKNDKFNVLLTSKVLDEGYNLPKIDTAAIMAGDSTAKQTIQRMGRVLRKKDKDSTLYQIYVKNTIEEDYAWQRANLFKELCSKYEQYIYEIDGDFEL